MAKGFLGQNLEWKMANKIEVILLVLFGIFLWAFDINQNKVLDLGSSYRVTWWQNTTSSALDLAIVFLILFHIILMILFLMNLGRGNWKLNTIDIFTGLLAFFGVAILLSGFTAGIYGAENIRFLFIDLKQVSYFHIGITIEILVALYWAFTK